ncbi:cation efflux family-domain-containing protein [Gongronella butleri]|nr:cation efflux family-domain-containing protein [Gongronella butleri]
MAFEASGASSLAFVKHSLAIILDSQDSKQIFYFLLLNLTYMFVQLAYGVWTNSLGLISDAIHMFFDCLALAIGLFASVMSKWPSNTKYSYGYNRIETISAYFNGIFLVLISISIVMEAIQRLLDPPEMNTQRLLLVSFVGLVVNLVGIFAFNHGHAHGHGHDHGHGQGHHHGHDHHGHSANMEGVFLHILADTMGSVGVIISTLLIKWFGWTGFDPIASLMIAILIILSVIPLIKNSASVLMLEVDDASVRAIEGTLAELRELPGVSDIALPRFWPNEAGSLIGSVHVHVGDDVDTQEMRQRVTELLKSHISGLHEVCVQVEPASAIVRQQQKGFFHTPNANLSVPTPPYAGVAGGVASSAIHAPVNYRSSAAAAADTSFQSHYHQQHHLHHLHSPASAANGPATTMAAARLATPPPPQMMASASSSTLPGSVAHHPVVSAMANAVPLARQQTPPPSALKQTKKE